MSKQSLNNAAMTVATTRSAVTLAIGPKTTIVEAFPGEVFASSNRNEG